MSVMTKNDLVSVHLRFRTSRVPEGLPEAEPEDLEIMFKTATAVRGEELWMSEGLVDLEDLYSQMKAAGYQLVAGYARERYNSFGGVRRSYVLHFHFVRVEEAKIPDNLEDLESALHQLVQRAYWRTQVFRNPGENGTWLSFACTSREQRFAMEDPAKPREITANAVVHFNGGDPVLKYN